MCKILFKNAHILCRKTGYNYDILDVYVENGKIKKIEKNIKIDNSYKIIDINKNILCAGFIDIHTHSYKFGAIGTEADKIGILKGSTTIFDAGTAGSDNIDDFVQKDIKNSITKIYSILNVSKYGLKTLDELKKTEDIDEDDIRKAIEKNRKYIKGIKVRASGSVVGMLGIEPIKRAKKIANEHNIPLIVHIGNAPPLIEEVLNILEKGDILTHTFNGKENGILLPNGDIKKELIRAIDRGVLLDVGHGSESFSFDIFRLAMKKGISPDFISTDLYYKNIDKDVISLSNVMTKLINLGMSLEDAIYKVTSAVSSTFGLDDRGAIDIGMCADINIIELEQADEQMYDSLGKSLHISKKIKIRNTLISKGEYSELFTYNN